MKSEIDEYIESVSMAVMTRWQHTNGLLVGSRSGSGSGSGSLGSGIRNMKLMGRLSDMTNSFTLAGLKFIEVDVFILEIRGGTIYEKRFHDLTKNTHGLLPRSRFSEYIGMDKDSQEFAGELFDALTRRRNIKHLMEDFLNSLESFDSRLQTFLDMIDTDGDGRITKDDVTKIIRLSASTNKLPNIENQADKYATFIMEELDPDNVGYLMIESLEMLLLRAQHNVREESGNLKTRQSGNLVKRWYQDLRYYLQDMKPNLL